MTLERQMKNKIAKTKLSSAISIALFPLLLSTSMAVYSQEQDATQENANEDGVEVIEVTGFRASATQQLNNKRFSKNISDSIFAEDMGKMPDANIAEAMARITGIGIDRVDGEGTEITIRGVEGSLNNVQMNGVTMSNSGDDNSVDFSSMSADMLRSIEVIKSPSASHDEGSLGGTVLLNTWKPLDIKNKRTIIDVKGLYNDLSEEFDPSIGLSFGNNFSDNFGMTASANYSESHTRQDRLTNYRWQFRNMGNATSLQTGELLNDGGNTRVFDPLGYEKNLSLIENKNLSLSSTLQYKFNDDASVWVDLTYSSKDKTKLQYNQTITNVFSNANNGTSAVVDEIAGTTVTASTVGSRARMVAFEQPVETDTTTIGINYQQLLFDGAWTLDALFGYSGSTSHFPLERSRRLIFNSGAAGAQPATINWLNDNGGMLLAPDYTLASGDSFPPEAIPVQSAQYLTRDSKDDNFTYQLDLQGDVEFGPISGVAFGVKIVSRERDGQGFVFAANLNDPDVLNENGQMLGQITLADYALNDFPADNYLTRVVGTELNGWPVPDFEAVYSTFLSDPLTRLNASGEVLGQVLDDEEPSVTSFDSTALYVMADFELMEGKLLGDFGVRWVKTEALARGRAGYNFTNWDPQGLLDEEGNVIGGAFNGGNFSIADNVFGEIEYNNALPSFNARYMAADDMLIRFSVAKVMARPKPSLLVPGYTITARNGTAEPGANGGNPSLKPTEVIQYDLSWEWYFQDTAMVSAAAFYKDFLSLSYTKIDSRGFDCASVEEFPVDQQQYADLHCAQIVSDVATTSTVNGEGGKVFGAEFSYQQDFTFLPGWAQYFGTVINYTYADSEATYVDAEQEASTAELIDGFPMQNTSKHTLNSTLYWENEGFSARIAYNYRSKRLSDPYDWDGALWVDDRATLDFSAKYSVDKNLSFTLAATNLTDTYNRTFITRLNEEPQNGLYTEGNALDGDAPDWRTFIADHNGRNIRVGVNYKF